ncbi:MAG: methyltransferase domain-containing protein [Chloroflexi bacterium]|nr:methyltransferase domain-containing protein [Chloroflexota bacterium]
MMDRPLSYILKVFFHYLYHGWAWTYDIVAATVSVGLWKRWVLSVLPQLQGPRVLEIGHGPGHLLVALLEQGWEVAGIDESRQMGRLARRRIGRTLGHSSKDAAYAHEPELARALAQALPFASAAFDSVVSTFPTRYIFEPAALRSIYRVLCPGGILVVGLTGWITGRSLPQRLAALLFRVTGESDLPLAAIQAPFISNGFKPETRWVDLGTSRVLLILAHKP